MGQVTSFSLPTLHNTNFIFRFISSYLSQALSPVFIPYEQVPTLPLVARYASIVKLDANKYIPDRLTVIIVLKAHSKTVLVNKTVRIAHLDSTQM